MARTVENSVEYGITGSFQREGERIGWMAVRPCIDEERDGRFGTVVELSVGRIGTSDGVIIREEEIRYTDEEAFRSVKVASITEPHMAYIFFDRQDARQDWVGVGFMKALYDLEPHWSAFGKAFRDDSTFLEGKWAVGDEAILRSLRSAAEEQSTTPEQAARLYGTMYIRFNRLLVESQRTQQKHGASRPKPLSDILLIDPNMTGVMAQELEKAEAYEAFTQAHLAEDSRMMDRLSGETPSGDWQDLARLFVESRTQIAARHEVVLKGCRSMLDNVYVPSGFRIGAGRTWPFMDIDSYEYERRSLMKGNLAQVDRELQREGRELEYKLAEFVRPHVTTLRVLAGGAADATFYG